MSKYKLLLKTLLKSNCNVFIVFFFYVKFRLRRKNILMHQKVKIIGAANIYTTGLLKIGIDYVAFDLPNDNTLLHVTGKLNLMGNVAIGRRCRISIDGTAMIGENTYINSNCLIIIQHSLVIGANCAISWNCQFLDDDFHILSYADKKQKKTEGIHIGNKVLICSNTYIYKGAIIPDGCVVAANSVVRDIFEEKNVLIAGNPARIVKRNISWS